MNASLARPESFLLDVSGRMMHAVEADGRLGDAPLPGREPGEKKRLVQDVDGWLSTVRCQLPASSVVRMLQGWTLAPDETTMCKEVCLVVRG